MRKKAIVSIRNSDNKCFLRSVLRYLHPREKNDCRLSDLRKHENKLNTKGIKFPVKIKDISKFESLNPVMITKSFIHLEWQTKIQKKQ